jgi:hypothetical protein
MWDHWTLCVGEWLAQVTKWNILTAKHCQPYSVYQAAGPENDNGYLCAVEVCVTLLAEWPVCQWQRLPQNENLSPNRVREVGLLEGEIGRKRRRSNVEW